MRQVVVTTILVYIFFSVLNFAVHAQDDSLNCPETADEMAKRAKETLTFNYHDRNSMPLKTILMKVDYMLEEAGYCAATARAGGNQVTDRQKFIMEWHSMNQWLSRLAGFIALNVDGDYSQNWKKEYEIFMEVYDLEP